MKTLFATTALVFTLAAPIAAHADIGCNIRDTVGNNLTYMFGANSVNSDGSFGGTLVETGFEKNGTMVISERGVRPIWLFNANVAGGYNLHSRAAPGWTLSVFGSRATLTHNGRFAGGGYCNPVTAGAGSAVQVGDLGD
jgi:hypothetical protein